MTNWPSSLLIADRLHFLYILFWRSRDETSFTIANFGVLIHLNNEDNQPANSFLVERSHELLHDRKFVFILLFTHLHNRNLKGEECGLRRKKAVKVEDGLGEDRKDWEVNAYYRIRLVSVVRQSLLYGLKSSECHLKGYEVVFPCPEFVVVVPPPSLPPPLLVKDYKFKLFPEC